MSRVYLSPPHLGDEEAEFVRAALESNWITSLGPDVDAFEQEVVDYLGGGKAVALNSGTAAIHLSLRHLGIGPGDEVFCSTLTFAASANPIVYERAEPVFVDAGDDWNMDPDLLKDELKRQTLRGTLPKAVIVTDLFGQCADYERIEAECAEYGVPLIEDAAEAFGSRLGERMAGRFGWAGILSFNGNKIITTSGGGMLVSEDDRLIEHARKMATQSRDPAPHYQHSEIGFNYRLSNVLAALGRGQLRVLPSRVERRRKIFERYRTELGELPGIRMMPELSGACGNRWLTALTVDPEEFGADREQIRLSLEAENIEARPVWKPLHTQPIFAGSRRIGGAVAERIFVDGLCLPSGTGMTTNDQERVIAVVRALHRS